MRNTNTDPRHEATVTALEHRVAARGTLDEYDRGQLEAVRMYSPTLEPRVDEVLRSAEWNTAAKAKRARAKDEERATTREHWDAFVERGKVR